jgi:2-oxoglutarate ferredoxin oxidoreductase subunit delta
VHRLAGTDDDRSDLVTAADVTRGTVVIDVEKCKGCELCIDACPPGVLTMTVEERNDRGYCYPRLHEGCIACSICAQICPDFCFEVWKYDEPLANGAPVSEEAP